jgi:hypothetical protein
LDDFFIPHVADGTSADIDTSRGITFIVFVSELCDEGDGVDASVLCKSVWNNLESLCRNQKGMIDDLR